MARWMARIGIFAFAAMGCGGRTIETEVEVGSGGTQSSAPAGGARPVAAGGGAVTTTGGTVSVGTGGAGFAGSGTIGNAGTTGTGVAGAGPEVEPPPDCGSGEPVMIPPEVVVERLSFVFLGVPPPNELLRRGLERDLSTSAAVGCFAREILLDLALPDFGIGQFFLGLLNARSGSESFVDPVYVPEFNSALLTSALESSTLFAKAVIRQRTGTLSELLLSPDLFVNQDLGSLLGLDADGDDFVLVRDVPERAGLFTQPYFLMSRSSAAHGSPTQRGLALMRALTCLEIPSPPEDIVLSSVPAVFEGTTRAWYDETIFGDLMCLSCHIYFTSTGFSFEHFDVIGRYREQEAGQPIDASGTLRIEVEDIQVSDHHETMRILSTHPAVHECMARQWLGHAVGIARTGTSGLANSLDPPPSEQGVEGLVRRARYGDGFNLRELFVAGVETPEFLE